VWTIDGDAQTPASAGVSAPSAFDFAVIGAGIAGASAAYELQAHGRTLLLEREALPGQHTTGRSAAFLVESYGNGVVQRLTRASRGFLDDPPHGFSAHPLVHPRPSLWIARPDQQERLGLQLARGRAAGVDLEEVGCEEVRRLCPSLRKGYAAAGVLEPRAKSIDVAGLLAAYVRGFRARGGVLVSHAELTDVARDGAGWVLTCQSASESGARHRAGVVVNAAGAWAERIGVLAGAAPIGLRPLRRTVITFDPPAGADIRKWPCMIDADEEFYLKPEGAQLLASPCDETESEPCDAVPDDHGVALAAERVQRATTLTIETIRRRWAGLRSFVADRAPVIGVDPTCPGFCWLAGQGGFGIMTAPAAARAAASLVVHGALPADLRALGLDESDLSPARLASA
jgi:D-arginine dehydrogenase